MQVQAECKRRPMTFQAMTESMMKLRWIARAFGLTLLFGATAHADSAAPLSVVLPEGLSPRTVGYYLAQDKGYFDATGVQVTFTASGDAAPSTLLVKGQADLAVDLMPVVLNHREDGDNVVHVAQIFRKAGMELVCRATVDRPASLKNHVVGVYFGGLESSFYAWMSALGLNPFGGPGSVTVLRQNFGLEAFQRSQADCATTFTYRTPLDFAAAGLKDLKLYRYDDAGVATLEDGLYARGGDLGRPERVSQFAAFLAAATKGWRFAHNNPKAAFDLIHADPAFANADATALRQAIDAVDDLVAPDSGPIGKLDRNAYNQTVNLLLTAAPDPVLTKAPAGAITDAVWKAMK
jgi:NitT/TauT family transport system substrate-binding protein